MIGGMDEIAYAAGAPPLTVLPVAKRIRVLVGPDIVADTLHARLLLEKGAFPVYYFPPEDVRAEFLAPSSTRSQCPRKGEASYRHLVVGERRIEDAAWCYEAPLEAARLIAGRWAFDGRKIDRLLEEDEALVGHVRSPFHRIDTRASTRLVRVTVGGEIIAETRRAVLLFETGIRPRAYIPRADVALDRLSPSATRTICPYKGEASYWSVSAGGRRFPDVVWCYEAPFPEAIEVKGLLAFWDEKVDRIEIAPS
jgi:uncharacterized protein (DUF427 family)